MISISMIPEAIDLSRMPLKLTDLYARTPYFELILELRAKVS